MITPHVQNPPAIGSPRADKRDQGRASTGKGHFTPSPSRFHVFIAGNNARPNFVDSRTL